MRATRTQTGRAAQCPGLGRRADAERAELWRAARTFLWLLALGKGAIIGTLIVVALRMRYALGAAWWGLALLNWSWLLLATLLLAGPLARTWRLRRARRRRAALIRAEWLID